MAARTQQPFSEALRDLLDERGWSLRELARQLGVDVAYLSRAVAGRDGKSAGLALIARIATLLELPDDYFPETREGAVLEAVRADPALRERIYRQLSRRT